MELLQNALKDTVDTWKTVTRYGLSEFYQPFILAKYGAILRGFNYGNKLRFELPFADKLKPGQMRLLQAKLDDNL